MSEVWAIFRFLLRKEPTIVGTGLLLTIAFFVGNYVLAITTVGIAALWGSAAWVNSDTIAKRRPRRPRPSQTHKMEAFRRAKISYSLWKWSMPAVFVCVFVIVCFFVNEQHIDKQLEAYEGNLTPANEPTPANPCGEAVVPKGALIIILGDGMAAFASRFPQTVIKIGNDEVLTLDKGKDGNISITTDIFDSSDDIVVGIDHNHFNIVKSVYTKEISRDRSQLRVTLKHKKEEVLNVRYLNSTTVRIDGVFRHPGDPVLRITQEGAEFAGQRLGYRSACAGDNGGSAFYFSSNKSGN